MMHRERRLTLINNSIAAAAGPSSGKAQGSGSDGASGAQIESY